MRTICDWLTTLFRALTRRPAAVRRSLAPVVGYTLSGRPVPMIAGGATNRVEAQAERTTVAVADAMLHAGASVASGAPVCWGQMPGVALVDEDTTNNECTIQLDGVFSLAVKGEDAAGNAAIAAGAIIYMDTDGELNIDATNGRRFGYARAAVSSGATTTIEVQVGY